MKLITKGIILILGLLLLLWLSGWLCIMAQETIYLGEVEAGSTSHFSWEIYNFGPTEVNTADINVSCSCILPLETTWKIPPFSKVLIPFELVSSGQINMLQSVQIGAKTNNLFYPIISTSVEFLTKESISITPKEVLFFPSEDNFRLIKIRSSNQLSALVSIDIERNVPYWDIHAKLLGATEAELEIRAKHNRLVGELDFPIVVHLRFADRSMVSKTINVVGRIEAALTKVPNFIIMTGKERFPIEVPLPSWMAVPPRVQFTGGAEQLSAELISDGNLKIFCENLDTTKLSKLNAFGVMYLDYGPGGEVFSIPIYYRPLLRAGSIQ